MDAMEVVVAVGNEPQVLRQDALENLFPDSDDDGEEFNGFTQQDIDEVIFTAPGPKEVYLPLFDEIETVPKCQWNGIEGHVFATQHLRRVCQVAKKSVQTSFRCSCERIHQGAGILGRAV